MSVTITKRVGGGFNVQVYTGILRPIRNLSYTSDGLGVRLINESGGYYTPENIPATDWVIEGVSYVSYQEIGDALDALGTGIIGGDSDDGIDLQNQQLAAQTALNDKIDVLISEQDNPGIIAKLEELRVIDATDSIAISNIYTELQDQGLELDKIDSLKTSTDAITTAINVSEAAEALRDANQLNAINSVTNKNEEVRLEVKQQGEDIVAAINGQSNTNRQEVVGTDDGNGTTIIQIVDIVNGIEQPPVYQNLDRTPYTLIGNFVTSQTVSGQFQIIKTLLRATVMNAGAGYEVDELIERTDLVDTSTNTILNTQFLNTETATTLITANVVETELSRRIDIPRVVAEEIYHKLDTQNIAGVEYEVIVGNNIKKLFREDGTVIWVDETGSIIETPSSGTEELVLVTERVRVRLEPTLTFPLIFEARTLKEFSIGVELGEYTVQFADNPPVVLTPSSFAEWERPVDKEGFVYDRIEIQEITPGNLRLSALVPATQRNIVRNAVDLTQLFVDANSNFIIDATDTGLITDNGVNVTTIATPPESPAPDSFSGTNTVLSQSLGNGINGLVNSNVGSNTSDLTAILTKSTPNSLTNASYFVGGLVNFGVLSGLARFSRPTFQVSTSSGGDLIVRPDISIPFQNIPISSLNLTTDEFAGNKAVIFMFRRTTTNGGNDSLREFYVISENNPDTTGTPLLSFTVPFSTSHTSLRTLAVSNMGINYCAIIDSAAEADWLSFIKTKIGI